jgi:hypothetical protein
VTECVDAIALAAQLSRRACRDHVLMNFTAKLMTDGYEAIYQKILGEKYSRNGQKRDLVMQSI